MILILDTNILIYASSFEAASNSDEKEKQKNCRQLVEKLKDATCLHKVAISQDIRNEYYNRQNWPRHNIIQSYVTNFFKPLGDRLKYVGGKPKLNEDDYAFLNEVKFDPNDIKFVALAVSEKIALIVSEDSGDYAPIKAYLAEKFNLEVLTAREAIGKIF